MRWSEAGAAAGRKPARPLPHHAELAGRINCGALARVSPRTESSAAHRLSHACYKARRQTAAGYVMRFLTVGPAPPPLPATFPHPGRLRRAGACLGDFCHGVGRLTDIVAQTPARSPFGTNECLLRAYPQRLPLLCHRAAFLSTSEPAQRPPW